MVWWVFIHPFYKPESVGQSSNQPTSWSIDHSTAWSLNCPLWPTIPHLLPPSILLPQVLQAPRDTCLRRFWGKTHMGNQWTCGPVVNNIQILSLQLLINLMLELTLQSMAFIYGSAEALQLHIVSSIFCSVKRTFLYLVKACVSNIVIIMLWVSHLIKYWLFGISTIWKQLFHQKEL